jgi:hypothetical protein
MSGSRKLHPAQFIFDLAESHAKAEKELVILIRNINKQACQTGVAGGRN